MPILTDIHIMNECDGHKHHYHQTRISVVPNAYALMTHRKKESQRHEEDEIREVSLTGLQCPRTIRGIEEQLTVPYGKRHKGQRKNRHRQQRRSGLTAPVHPEEVWQ